MRHTIAIVIMTLCIAFSHAQDIHFSQPDADPMLLNPAYSGFFDGQGRFGLIYRNQWITVSQPFQTFALTGEIGLWRSYNGTQGLSVGASMFSDHAGSLGYGTTSAHISLAYYFALNRHVDNILSFGIDGGYAQAGFNPSNALLDDPAEQFLLHQTGYPLLGCGIAWYYQPISNIGIRAGASLRNINQPNISYSGLDDTYMPRRFSAFARGEWRKWGDISLMPLFVFQRQGQYQELIYGADIKWYLQEGSQHEVTLKGGLALRQNDALIANLVMEYDAMLFSICYDANISDLANASQSIGAFELGFVYRMARGKKKTKAIKCPVY